MAETLDGRENSAAICIVKCVDNGEIMAVIEEEGVHSATLPLAYAVNSWGDFHRSPPYRTLSHSGHLAGSRSAIFRAYYSLHRVAHDAPAAVHGLKALLTPRSADRKCGKWRSSTVDMSLSATQSRPTWV